MPAGSTPEDEGPERGMGDRPPALPVINSGDSVQQLGGPATRRALFDALGGRAAVGRVVDRFYDLVDADPLLRPVFPASLEVGRARQKLFLEEWLGGEPRYSTEAGPWRLRRRHARFRVTTSGAARWLELMERALRECGADDDLAGQVVALLRPVADRMVNTADVEQREA